MVCSAPVGHQQRATFPSGTKQLSQTLDGFTSIESISSHSKDEFCLLVFRQMGKP